MNAYLAMLWGIHGDFRPAHGSHSYKFGHPRVRGACTELFPCLLTPPAYANGSTACACRKCPTTRRSARIADAPILSSSPRNGSGTAMNADLSLVEQSDSSACPARSLQNVPVRPPIAQSTPSFFCTFPRISQKIALSQRLLAGCSLDTEGIGRKSQEKEGSRFCTEVAVGEPIGRLRFVLSSCLRLRLTNRWPVPQEPYRQEPFLVDEDRIGGSAIVFVDFCGHST